MIRNPKLKEFLQLLAQSTLPLYKEKVPIDKKAPNYQINTSILLDKLDQEIIKNPIFGECINLMRSDEKIKALQGKVVGTIIQGGIIIENEEICITSFLRQLYIKKNEYDQDLFDKEYSSFEDLSYRTQYPDREVEG